MRSFFILAASFAAAFLACSTPAEPGAAPQPGAPTSDSGTADDASAQPLTWAPCDTKDWPDGFALPSPTVQCTTVTVPFDHAHPEDGRTLKLRVARDRARALPAGVGRAVFQLAGGPGGTSVGQAGTVPRYMPKLLDHFDLVYVDQRGTGGSGYLGCGTGYPSTKEEWIACAGEHAKEDLAGYLTVRAAHDLESVRVALGYGKISLRGGSYGTRLGLEYLRQHEARVNAVVLDGVDPPDNTFFRDFIVAVDRGVARLASDCKRSPDCAAITADVLADLTQHRAAVKATPRAIVADGAPAKEDEETFLGVLGAALFEAGTYSRVPRAIHGAATGDFAAWDALMSDTTGQAITEPLRAQLRGGAASAAASSAAARGLRTKRRVRGSSYVAPGLYMTVICAEDLPGSGTADALRTLDAAQLWGGDPAMVDLADACAAWKVPPLEAALRAPVRSDAKVLLLNGELDLNTFPEWGARAAATLPHARNVVVPGATHSTMSIPCVGGIITEFLSADGDTANLDISCLDHLAAPAW
jgi:pimeloyl-ACP methyl ester carboxylesterase